MDTIYNQNQDELAKQAAQSFAQEINEILVKKDKAVVAIPGGRSVVSFFKEAAHLNIDWTKVHFFMVDERRVALDHNDSNFGQAKKLFLDELVPKENLHPYKHNEDIKAYEDELKNYDGKFDIVVLGVGEDGHTAGLYPNHHTIKNDEEYFITFDDSPKPPPLRMSASKKLIKNSDVSFLFFIGDAKKEAYKNFLDKNIDEINCPAKIGLANAKTIIITNLN